LLVVAFDEGKDTVIWQAEQTLFGLLLEGYR